MNWTGGSLQRHSKNAQDSVAYRQREHFANVRTALQEEPDAPSAPFRPDFLRLEDSEQLPQFEVRSARHHGHSKRRRHHSQGAADSAPRVKRRRRRTPRDETESSNKRVVKHRRDKSVASRRNRASDRSQHVPRVTRKASAEDIEQRLGADAVRLLEEPDWAGLEPLKMAKIRFTSGKEKDRIGKRRNIVRHHRERRRVKEKITRDTRYNVDGNNNPGPCTAGASRDAIEGIKVRIGTDALDSQSQTPTPGKSHDNAQVGREESSESMLFDNDEHVGAVESNPVLQSVNIDRGTSLQQAFPQEESGLDAYGSDDIGLAYQNQSQDDVQGLACSVGSPAVHLHRMPLGSAQQARLAEPYERHTLTSQYRVIGGSRHNPIRLTFQTPDPPARGTATKAEAPACSETNAGFSSLDSPRHQKRVRPRTPVVLDSDEVRWRSILAIGCDTSSSSPTAALSSTSQPAGRHRLSEGPQNATLGDEQSIGVSSPISALLPRAKHTESCGTMESTSHVERSRRTRPSHVLADAESEEYWRKFAFGHKDANPLPSSSSGPRTKWSRQRRDMTPAPVGVASPTSSVLSIVEQASHRARPSLTARSSSFMSALLEPYPKSRSVTSTSRA